MNYKTTTEHPFLKEGLQIVKIVGSNEGGQFIAYAVESAAGQWLTSAYWPTEEPSWYEELE